MTSHKVENMNEGKSTRKPSRGSEIENSNT